MSPDKILDSVDFLNEEDTSLLNAVLDYAYTAAVEEKRTKGSYHIYNLGGVISRCVSNLLNRCGEHVISNGSFLAVINQSAKSAEICIAADAPEGVKEISKIFKNFAEAMRPYKPKLTLSHLELLVNARKYNKRLPKELSAFIKDILDGDVHSIGNYWDQFSELSTLEGQLRKLWIQCVSLQLYNYNPDDSYTIKLISEIVPSVIQSENAEAHYLFCRVMHDAEIKSVTINGYEEILDRLIKQTKDKRELLLLYAARLLNKKIKANTSWIDKIGTGQPIEFPGSPTPRNAIRDTTPATPYDIEGTIKRHPTWPKLAAEFVTLQEKGISMKAFCEKNRLSEPAFAEFYRAVMADIEKTVQTDPFLQKISRLPTKEQNEYAALSKRRLETMQKMCDAASGIIGEKVEIKDMFGNGKVNKELDRKLNDALKRFKSIDPKVSVAFTLSILELEEIESQIANFLSEHGI